MIPATPRSIRDMKFMVSSAHEFFRFFAYSYAFNFPGVPKDQLPCTESLKDTIARFIPAWEEEILPTMKSGKRVLIAGL